jgi:eukaryotic-like serine/threonine-protein kinase
MALQPGATLGPYEILSLIGAGGMGEVYRARDTKLGRDVAIKILPRHFTSDPDRLARFEREARVLASLNHPHIGAIYGLEDADGVRALVLELVDGETLADRIARGPIPLTDTLTIARQIADALDAAHEKGIVHRDLKPANIKITPDGVVKVLDFGLAKTASGDAATPDLTQSPTVTFGGTREGVILGTAAYMSPEQARGQTVDKRTDIWAFACVVSEMLTRRTVFAGETASDTIAAILEREPDWSRLPASTPVSIHRLLQRCLQKDARRRLRDIGDARMELDEAASGAGQAGSAVAPTSRGWSRVLTSAAIVTSLIAISVVISRRTVDPKTATIPSLGPRFSRVTWDASFSTEPALSPDGTLAVYASDRGGPGQLDLWLQRIAGGQPIRLTNDPADDREPDFSADGSLIAFRSNRRGGGVYVMPTLGGDARLVAEGGRSPRFAPDGTRIAYWTGRWLGGARASGKALFLVPSIGGQQTRIADGFVTAFNPIWSPDGRSILFFGRKAIDNSPTGGFDWWWTSLEADALVPTGAYLLLAEKGLYGATSNNSVAPAQDALPAVWTTEGVLFSARLGESVNLWRVKISETSGKVIDGSLERLTHGAGSDLLPSADGTGRIAFQVSNESGVSLTLPLEPNGGKALGPIERQSYESILFQNGRNSLDDAGRFLAYPKGRANESEIWVKDLTTGQERHVVTTPPSQLNPVISHDATKVAYTVPEGGSVAGFVIPVAGGPATKVCDACSWQGWFADNRRILALTPGPGRSPGRVRIVDVVDKTAHDALIDPTSGIGRADISPDSQRLAFSSRGRVWIAPLRLGTPTSESDWVSVLTPAEGSGERACGWSPDGRLLYLLLEQDGFRDLYAQRVDATRGAPIGEPFLVQHIHDPRLTWGSTPYGTAIVRHAFVFNQYESTGSIWLLDPGRNANVANRSRAGTTN